MPPCVPSASSERRKARPDDIVVPLLPSRLPAGWWAWLCPMPATLLASAAPRSTILGAFAYGQTLRRRWHTRQASSNAELQAAIVDYEQSTIDLVTDSKTQFAHLRAIEHKKDGRRCCALVDEGIRIPVNGAWR